MNRLPAPVSRVTVGLAVGVSLAVIASVAPSARLPDSYWYTSAAERTIVPGCSAIHCFRILVAWTLGLFPGVVLKWKVYSVIFNTLAVLAVADLSRRLGLSRRAAIIA